MASSTCQIMSEIFERITPLIKQRANQFENITSAAVGKLCTNKKPNFAIKFTFLYERLSKQN